MKSRLREITSCFRVLFHTSGHAHIVRFYTKSRRYVGGSKQRKVGHIGVPKNILWEFNSF